MKISNFKIIKILSVFFSTIYCADQWLDVVPVDELLKKNPAIQYHKCYDEIPFNYAPCPLTTDVKVQPHKGYFKQSFILTIPDGMAQSYGFVLVNKKQFIQELIWKGLTHNLARVQKFNDNQIVRVKGRVAVISQTQFENYWHWTTEVLCHLAMLELQNVKYDYLYVPQVYPFMKETLQLWGIDPSKIIAADVNVCVQADELIVPSLVSNVNFGGVLGACYVQPHLLEYVKNKLLNAALKRKPSKNFKERVFISRKDAPQRQIINEDAVFALFQAKGFERYELAKLSVTDQILLFHNAKIIVSPQGTGLANTIYCKPKTRIVELLQGLNDCTFWYLSQILNLDYSSIKTTTFLTDPFQAWSAHTHMPLPVIKEVISNLKL